MNSTLSDSDISCTPSRRFRSCQCYTSNLQTFPRIGRVRFRVRCGVLIAAVRNRIGVQCILLPMAVWTRLPDSVHGLEPAYARECIEDDTEQKAKADHVRSYYEERVVDC